MSDYDYGGDRLSDQYEGGGSDFEDRVACARKAPKLTGDQEQFLDDIEGKYDEYGEDMFFSIKQRRYLQMLAVRGGWRPRSSDSDDNE